MEKYNFTDVFNTYNAVVTLLRGLSDPDNNRSAKVVMKRWQVSELTEFESEIIRKELLNGEKKTITAPYVVEYTGNKIYFIFTDEPLEYVKSTTIESAFKDIPNQIYLYINKDAFMFNLTDNIDEINIYRTYDDIFLSIIVDMFSTGLRKRDLIFGYFFTTLFLLTNSKVNKKVLKELYTPEMINTVSELLETNPNVVNEFGYIRTDDFQLANKINEIYNTNFRFNNWAQTETFDLYALPTE